MTNIDNFKSFVRKNPTLITYVHSGDMSWQKFYELYDLYGEDESIWEKYKKRNEIKASETTNKSTTTNNFSLSNIMEMAKNIDTNKLQDGITSVQKAISLLGDMLLKDKQDTNTYTPRPIYRRFDD